MGLLLLGDFSVGRTLYKLRVLADCIGLPSYSVLPYSCHLFYLSLSFSSDFLSATSAYVVFFSWFFRFTTMSNSSAGPSTFGSGPPLATESDSLRLQRLEKGDLRGDNSMRGNIPFYIGTHVSNYRAYINLAHFADMFMDDYTDRAWTPAVYVIGRALWVQGNSDRHIGAVLVGLRPAVLEATPIPIGFAVGIRSATTFH